MVQKPSPNRKQKEPHQKSKSVFREAWENMNDDLNRVLPEKLRRKDKKKFVLWMFVLELIILAAVGIFLYDWLAK